ncbi:hypothetical protein Raf01_30220 [Rugosimonospora africana]|uniref:Uncharacterized protein n=1 Tax=Rugosimonospora africana TaxID=556532 RepID=A0A8J3QP64_9ACTN|nr:hypothetical protein Raf01_30220 [Rugosimonospora africana]
MRDAGSGYPREFPTPFDWSLTTVEPTRRAEIRTRRIRTHRGIKHRGTKHRGTTHRGTSGSAA